MYSNIVKILEGKVAVIAIIIALVIVQSSMIAYISSINFSIMAAVEENNKSNAVYYLSLIAIIQCIRHLIRYARRTLFTRKVLIPSNEQFKRRFMNKLFLNSDPAWIHENKPSEIYSAIESGSKSMIDILAFITEISSPIIQSIGSLMVIQIYMNSLISIVILMFIIFSMGAKLMYDEYHKLKEVNKKTNPLSAYNNHLTESLLTDLLNGNGYGQVETIISNSVINEKLTTNISLQTRGKLTILELIGLIGILSIVIMIDDISVAKLIALSLNIEKLLEGMWHFFHRFAYVSKSVAKWAVLESFLESRVPLKQGTEELLSFEVNGITSSEFHIDGESGSGKSRWLIKTVIDLSRKFQINWVVVPQKFNVPTSNCTTIRKFLGSSIPEEKVLHYAALLRLTIINKSTLHCSFKGPSGGEERRIGFLKNVLPVLIGEKKILVIFLDEISAGLDPITRLAVRKVIEELKELGVIVVNIDHNKFESKHVARIPIELLTS